LNETVVIKVKGHICCGAFDNFIVLAERDKVIGLKIKDGWSDGSHVNK